MLGDPLVRRAVTDSLPILAPALPFAMVLGLAISESLMPAAAGWLTSPVIYGGAAQLATVSLAGTVPWLTLVASASVISARHLMYSAALAARFRPQPRWFRWVGPYMLIDQVFALTSVRAELDATRWRRYYLACGITFAVGWAVFVTSGLLAGGAIPERWRFDAAPAIIFSGLVVINVRHWPAAVAAVAGAGACLAFLSLPNNLGLVTGAAVGVVAGYVADRWSTPA